MARRWLALILVGLATAPAWAAPASAASRLVEARLLVDRTAVAPGGSFQIGILLKIAPGWHVYWINPGDSGMPTEVTLILPPGLSAGCVQYPVAVRFAAPGDLAAYGYSGEVLLTATVTVGESFRGESATLAADVSWLCCAQTCIPGAERVTMELPVAKTPGPSTNEATFTAWRKRMAVGASSAREIRRIEFVPGSQGEATTAVITWAADPPAEVALFTEPDDRMEVRIGPVKTRGRESRIAVMIQPLKGQSPRRAPLPGVLGYTTADGERRGVKVEIPMPRADADL